MEEPAFTLKPLNKIHLKDMVFLDSICFSKEDAYSLEVMDYYFSSPSSFSIGYFFKEKLIGFILCQRNHIITIDVHPDFRKKGLGKNLIEYAISRIKKKGYKKIFLEVDKDNHCAINLYKKLKFKIFKEFYENDKSRYSMCLKLI